MAPALAKHVAGNFFWMIDDRKDITQKGRSGIDNLARALYLDNPDTEGWDILAAFCGGATAGLDAGCAQGRDLRAPGEPKHEQRGSGRARQCHRHHVVVLVLPGEEAGVEVRDGAARARKITGKLGMHLVCRFHPDKVAGGRRAHQTHAHRVAVRQVRICRRGCAAAAARRSALLRQGRRRLADRGLLRRTAAHELIDYAAISRHRESCIAQAAAFFRQCFRSEHCQQDRGNWPCRSYPAFPAFYPRVFRR